MPRHFTKYNISQGGLYRKSSFERIKVIDDIKRY